MLVAFVAAESILMTEVFVIPIRPETFDWSADGKDTYIQLILTFFNRQKYLIIDMYNLMVLQYPN